MGIKKYSLEDYLKFFYIEFFATIVAIFLFAAPASSAPLIGGLDFTTNPIIILFIAVTNGFTIYAIHAIYTHYLCGYTNILIAIVYIGALEYKKRGMSILFKITLLMIAEIAGAIVATLLLWTIIGDRGTDFGKPTIGPGVSMNQAFGYEIFGTFILVSNSAIANLGFDFLPDRALISGLLLFATVIGGVAISGASLNYVRHFGAAVVSNSFVNSDWLYYAGPTIGAIGAIVHIIVIKSVFERVSKYRKKKTSKE